MNILILGNGKEGQAIKSYFQNKNANIKIIENISKKDLPALDTSKFDMVFRSPSIPPIHQNWTSSTKYFLDNCICPVIGVTGTKGKGTTCTIIDHILSDLGLKTHLVGNIGNPAISSLDQIQPEDVAIYEMSSFQLWDCTASPHISVILRIEPDHLDVHKDYEDYISAKSNIAKYQTEYDTCIFFKLNSDSSRIAEQSPGQKIPYPIIPESKEVKSLLGSLSLAGQHNRENASAALLACTAFFHEPLQDFVDQNFDTLKKSLSTVKGLPHRLEFVRELNGIKYYDDNFSTTIPSLEVALDAFQENLVLILGGRDKTNNKDLPAIHRLLNSAQKVKKIILIGESGHELYKHFLDRRYILAETLEDAITKAKNSATETKSSIVLMSPAAASFDMFKNVYDRGDQYQKIINSLA